MQIYTCNKVFAFIIAGTSKDSVAVQIVTGNINGTFRYRITNTNGFFVKYFVFNATEKPKFILTYERSGMPTFNIYVKGMTNIFSQFIK